MNQVVTITGVETKSGNTDKGGWTLYKFDTAGGAKFQTFDDALGEKIKELIGQSAELEYELEENGDFKNNVIKSIKAANGNGNGATEFQHVAVAAAGQGPSPEADRQLRIMRQSALDRAINTVAAGIGGLTPEDVDVYQLFTLSDQFIHYFENGNS